MAIKMLEKKTSDVDCDLTVEQSGMTLTVRAGDFTIVGQEYQLEDDEIFVVRADVDNYTDIFGYLVKDVTGKVRLLVDEVVHDGEDEPFDVSASEYTPLLFIFNVRVPAQATSLDDEELVVRRFTIRDEILKENAVRAKAVADQAAMEQEAACG